MVVTMVILLLWDMYAIRCLDCFLWTLVPMVIHYSTSFIFILNRVNFIWCICRLNSQWNSDRSNTLAARQTILGLKCLELIRKVKDHYIYNDTNENSFGGCGEACEKVYTRRELVRSKPNGSISCKVSIYFYAFIFCSRRLERWSIVRQYNSQLWL